MESARRCPPEKPRALGTGKASHVISKLAKYGGPPPGQRISPTIRIVHIFAPKVIKTDAANFRSLVQKLTGKSSSPSSARAKKAPADPRPDQNLLRRPRNSGSQLAAPAKMEESPEFYPFASEFAPLAEVKAEIVEEAANPWDNLAGLLGGFGDLDILLNSSPAPLLPEFLPADEQAWLSMNSIDGQ